MVDGVSMGTKGPNLTNAGHQFQLDYLRASITDPTANIHSSKMPRFDWVTDDKTVEALVVYLKSLRKSSLRSLTQGKGAHSRDLAGYDPAPPDVTRKIIAEAEAQKEEEHR